MPRPVARPLAAAASAAALLIGCGDDDEQGARESDRTATRPVTTAPETAPDATTGATATTAGPRDCGDVGFKPNSDAGAFGITAEGIDCGTARAVAGAAEHESGLSFSARGFHCVGERGETELPSVAFTCTREGATVRFDRS